MTIHTLTLAPVSKILIGETIASLNHENDALRLVFDPPPPTDIQPEQAPYVQIPGARIYPKEPTADGGIKVEIETEDDTTQVTVLEGQA